MAKELEGIQSLIEDNMRLRKAEQWYKKLLNMYDSIDNGEYVKFLDSFVLVVAKRFEKDMTTEQKLSLRQDMKDFLEARMTEL